MSIHGDQNTILKSYLLYPLNRTSLVAQTVKRLSTMWETWVQFLGWEDPLEKGKATHSGILVSMNAHDYPIIFISVVR